MHDGGESPFLPGLDVSVGRLEGFSPEGYPVVASGVGAPETARALVPLSPGDVGRDVALCRGPVSGVIVLGLIQPPLRVIAGTETPMVIESDRPLILRCGPASVSLFPDGRVEIRGSQVLSRAEGSNRVQGGSVNLN
jgi:hypothetical protein